MTKNIIICAALMLCSICASAQQNYKSYSRATGYKAFADVDLMGTFNDKTHNVYLGFSTSHGYQFFPYFFLGGGIGVDMHMQKNQDTFTYVPLFGQARVNLTNTRTSPYIDFKGGYSLADLEGGMLEASVGVSYAIRHRFAINMALVFTRNNIKYLKDVKTDEKQNHLSLQFGFEF